jgi:hypothetical protein
MAVASVTGATQNLIRTSVPNLISGVSQQADSFKLTTQAVEQINAVSSVVDGLIKRPSTYLTKEIQYDIPSSGATYPYGATGVAVYPKLTPLKYFKITTAELTDYIGIVFHNSSTNDKSIKIFDLDGNEKNVIYAGGSQAGINSYLSGITTEVLGSSIKTLSVADYTFFLNSSKNTAMLNTLSPKATAGGGGTEAYQGIVVVKTGYTGHSDQEPSGAINWSIRVVGVDGSFPVYASASGSSDAWNLPKASIGGVPKTIASDIATKLNAGIANAFGSGGVIVASGSNVYIQSTINNFKIIVDDGYAGSIFYAVKDNVQNFTDLPVIAPHGFIAKITGLPDSSGDEYYVNHTSNYLGSGSTLSQEFIGGFGNTNPRGIFAVNEGPWSETRGAGIKYQIDPATMPHALVKLNENNFLFTPINGATATYNLSPSGTKAYTAPSWGSRDAGDEESNPNPSFIDKSISNLFFFKNRLGLLSGESVILSQAGEFFNFFKSTTAQVLDSDPIDVSSSTSEIGNLYHAIPFYDRVVLFANGLQFSLQSDGELTSKSVSLQQSTSFNVDVNSEPIAVGNKIYFSVNKGNFSSVQEYFINPNTILLDGVDITANVPSYLNGSVGQFSGSDISSILLCSSTTKQHELGVYKFFYSGDEKIQSAWSKWSFGVGNNVKLSYITKDKIYFVFEKAGNFANDKKIQFCYMDLNSNAKDSIATPNIQVLLDYKSSNITYNSSISNDDGVFSLVTLNNFTFHPITNSNVKTSLSYEKYELPFSITTGFNTSEITYGASLSSFDLKLNKFLINSGLTFSSNGSFSYTLNPISTLATTSALSISSGQTLQFSLTLGKYKNFQLTGLENLLISSGSINATLFVSSNNSDFTQIATAQLSGTATSVFSSITPYALKGGAEERTYYFKIAFHSASINTNMVVSRNATAPTLNGFIYPSYQSFSNFNFGTTGIMYNRSPYQFVDANGLTYETFYAIYNTSNVVAVPTAGAISKCANNQLLIKAPQTSVTGGVVGLPYSMIYEISRPVLRSASGKGQSVVGDGRLQIKNGIMLYDNSRFFQVLVTPKYRDTYNYTYLYNFVPNYLGVGPTNLDYMHMEDGAFKFPVFCKSDEVKISVLNETPYPCSLLSLEWEALYSARSKRIG